MLLKNTCYLSLAVVSALLTSSSTLCSDEVPAETPIQVPTDAPAETPADAPVEKSVEAPADVPVAVPVETPANTPIAAPVETPVADDSPILIVPAEKLPSETTPQPVPYHMEPETVVAPLPMVIDQDAYRRIYRTIPFNRAEYNANPTYRHDTTMELLTGNARHQTIVKHTTVRPRPTSQIAPPVVPYRYNNPARGLNYYFYFPYWNFRGIY